MAIIRFNRQYTSAQLKAAKDTSSIAGGTENVVNGTIYVASDGDGIYVGNNASPSVLKLLGQVDTTLTAAQIISKLSDYMVIDPDTGEIDPTTVVPGADQAISANFASEAQKATKDGSGNVITTTYATKAEIQALDATVDKDASSSTAAIDTSTDVSSANAAIAVATGYTVVQTDGALVPNSSSIDSGRADKFGAANAALVQAKSYADTKKSEVIGTSGDASSASTIYGAKAYADSLITGLGTILTFKGVVATEAALKAQTNQNKGWVYIVSADNSEWVCTDNIGSTADPTKWEKFGTTDVNGALYYGDNTLTSGQIFVADGTAGKAKTTDTLGFDLNIGTSGSPKDLTVTGDLTAGVFTIGQGGQNSSIYGDISFSGDVYVGAGLEVQGEHGITVTEGGLDVAADASIGGDTTIGGELSVTGQATFTDDISALSVNTDTIKSSSAIVRDDGETLHTILDTSNIGSYAAKTVDGVTKNSSGVVNAYGECSIAAGTAAKTVSITAGTIGTIDSSNGKGTRVAVKFANANTASTPTLNVNSSGAKSISIQGATVGSGAEKNLIKGTLIFEWTGAAWEAVGLEKGSGSIGSTSSATDAWKTVVHDVALSADLAVSGNTKSIPAAAATVGNTIGNDGYMTTAQATSLVTAISALTWQDESAE